MAHMLLYRENPHEDKLAYAWHCMHYVYSSDGGQDIKREQIEITADEYAEMKEAYSKAVSNTMTGKHKGKRCYSNGINEIKRFEDDDIPEGYVLGSIESYHKPSPVVHTGKNIGILMG